MTEPETTDCIIRHGQALVRAIEALETIEATGALERGMVWLLPDVYRSGLRGIVGSAATWISEEILSASQGIGNDRPVLWMSDN